MVGANSTWRIYMTATVELQGMDQEPAFDALKRRNGADVPLDFSVSDKRAQRKRGGFSIASIFVHMCMRNRDDLRKRRKDRKPN